MRKIVFTLGVSLDGYFEGPNREIDWHMVDDEVHGHFNDFLGEMSAFLEGRVTYELMTAYWPTADQDPEADPRTVEFARIWRRTPKYVYSKTLQQADENATIVRDVVKEEVEALKVLPGGDMAVGGPDLVAEFRRLGLIDEYRVYVTPIILGAGRPMFLPGERIDLKLIETRTFGNGLVLLRYVPTG